MKRSTWMPNSCPVIERTADGVRVGRCWFHLRDGKTCRRHGDIDKLPDNYRDGEPRGLTTKDTP